MFVQKIVNKVKDKSYTNYLIIENYREGINVKHRTIANISKLPPYLIVSINKSLKDKINEIINDEYDLAVIE